MMYNTCLPAASLEFNWIVTSLSSIISTWSPMEANETTNVGLPRSTVFLFTPPPINVSAPYLEPR